MAPPPGATSSSLHRECRPTCRPPALETLETATVYFRAANLAAAPTGPSDRSLRPAAPPGRSARPLRPAAPPGRSARPLRPPLRPPVDGRLSILIWLNCRHSAVRLPPPTGGPGFVPAPLFSEPVATGGSDDPHHKGVRRSSSRGHREPLAQGTGPWTVCRQTSVPEQVI
ncbi:hypothetical protein EYF80_041368 [Liparis tanakae]|uniref:Uncharacterized protein n=1 Tax=Liparis tanakae TaxID=230148 RepID=A0A4Z2G7A3_9TELE|nr:hypothetical protein EYF80_041368 [Liparis tanakae]